MNGFPLLIPLFSHGMQSGLEVADLLHGVTQRIMVSGRRHDQLRKTLLRILKTMRELFMLLGLLHHLGFVMKLFFSHLKRERNV